MANTVVRARITPELKAEAEDVLHAMGLTISDAIRLLLTRITQDRGLPFELKVPNQVTTAAMAEAKLAKLGGGFPDVDGLLADLNRD